MRAASWIASSALALLMGVSLASCASEEEEHDEATEGDNWNSSYDEVVSNSCNGVKVPDNNGFKKRIALTFDDGPNLSTTPKVLDALKKHKAHATFFINGRRVTSAAHDDLLKRMVAEGHIIANHTQSHLNSVTLAESKFASEVSLTTDVVKKANAATYFRFPFGSSNCSTMKTVQGQKYRVVGWHVDSGDWCFANSKEPGYCPESTFKYVPTKFRRNMAGYVLEQIRDFGGGIVLFHDIHQYTVDSLDGILTEFEKEGYTFTSLDDKSAFPKLNSDTVDASTPTPTIGSACTKNEDCAFGTGNKLGFCYGHEVDADGKVTRGYCSMRCEGLCPGAATFCVSRDSVQADTGFCAIKADGESCSKLPGTTATKSDRYLGESSAAASTATVCLGK